MDSTAWYNTQFTQQHQPRDYYHPQDSPQQHRYKTSPKWSPMFGQHNGNVSAQSNGHGPVYTNGLAGGNDDTNASNTSQQSKGRQKTIWDVLGVFAGVTSLQGVPYIQKANRWWSTGFWILAFLVGCGFMIFHAVYLIRLYIQNDLTTRITLGYEHLNFPSVTICNMNPFLKHKIDNTSLAMKQFLSRIDPSSQNNQSSSGPNTNKVSAAAGFGNPRPNDPNKRFAMSETESYHSSNLHEFFELYGELPVETRREVGQRADIFIQECSFNGYECTDSDFNHHPSPMYGNCWTFNGAENSTSSLVSYLPGKDYGLNLRLYIEGDQYLPGISEDVGAVVAVHPYGTMSFPEQNGISVAAGMTTLIGLKLINVTRQGRPYSECKHGSQFPNDQDTRYTREGCIATCAHVHIKDQCSCYMAPYEYYYPKGALKQLPRCGEDQESCIEKIMSEISSGALGCEYCIPACNEKSYDKQISASQWPQESFYSKIIEKACKIDQRNCQALREKSSQEIPKNFVNLKIYFRELNFENIEEQPAYELVQFVSDVGGVLGLWVGVSVLSVVEILQLVFELLNFGCKKHCCSVGSGAQNNGKT